MSQAFHREDIELFSRIAEGEEPAFRELFDRYKEKVFGFIFHMLERQAEAEELTQDTFLRIWVSRASLKEVNNPGVYIFVIAKNRTLDFISREAREHKTKLELSRTTSLISHSTEEDIDFLQTSRLIHSAVHELPHQQALVFRLTREEGLRRQEIAERLNISENTVKNHLSEATKSIRHYLRIHGQLSLLALLWYICR